jgi:hypothetical protein
MRTTEPQVSMSAVPPPGTTEALELGCTCHLIAHEVVTQEGEPAGILIDPDPIRIVHGMELFARKCPVVSCCSRLPIRLQCSGMGDQRCNLGNRRLCGCGSRSP